MNYYDPPSYDDWEADFNCRACEKDTIHYFCREGRGRVTYAQCTECQHEEELDPDYDED